MLVVEVDNRFRCEYSTPSANPPQKESQEPSKLTGTATPPIVIIGSLEIDRVSAPLSAKYMFHSEDPNCLPLVESAADTNFLNELYSMLRRFFPLSVFTLEQFNNPEEEQESPSFVIEITRSERTEENLYTLVARFRNEWWFENRYRAPFFTILVDD